MIFRLILLILFIIFPKLCYPFSWSQLELHHIFPQDYNYRSWFASKDIDPNMWCIPLTREQHTGKYNSIHHKKYSITGGKNFNQSWSFFIKENPNASKDELFLFAYELLSEFGIDLNKEKFYNYNTKKISGVKFPNISKTTQILSSALRIGNKILKFGKNILDPEVFIIEDTISGIIQLFDDELIREKNRIIDYLEDGHIPKIESCNPISSDFNQIFIDETRIDDLLLFYNRNSEYWMSNYPKKEDFCKKSISEINKYIKDNSIKTHKKFLGFF